MTRGGSALAARPGQLTGFRVGITNDRRAGEYVAAFERRGAEVVHAPTIQTGTGDDAAVLQETRAIVAGRPDVLLANTGYGMRRWLELADEHGLLDDLLGVLGLSQVLVRGPKARGAVRAVGLEDQGMGARETMTALVDRLLERDVTGAVVAIQHPGYLDEEATGRLAAAGATVLPVSPYRWRHHDDTGAVLRLVEAVCGRTVDAVTFTSAPAVEAFFAVAAQQGLLDRLQGALREDVVTACVGPVTAAPLQEAGLAPLVPDRYRTGALIKLLCDHLETVRVLRADTDLGPLEVRGRCVSLAGRRASLTPGQLGLFRVLLAAQGRTVSQAELGNALPQPLDPRAVEVAVSRVRKVLPSPDLIRTVVKRGYRVPVT